MSKQQSSMESSVSSIPIQSLYNDTKFILHIPEAERACRECKLPLSYTPRLTVVGLTYKYTVSRSLRQELRDSGALQHFTDGMPDFNSMTMNEIKCCFLRYGMPPRFLRLSQPSRKALADQGLGLGCWNSRTKRAELIQLATKNYEAILPTLDLGYRYTEESPTEFSWSIEGEARIRYRLSDWGRAVGYSAEQIWNRMQNPTQGWNQRFYRDFFLRRSLGDPPRAGNFSRGSRRGAPRGGFGQWDFPDRAAIGDTSYMEFPNIPGAGNEITLYPEVPPDTHHLNLEVHITLGRSALNDSFSSMTVPQLKRLISKRIRDGELESIRNISYFGKAGIMDFFRQEVVNFPSPPRPHLRRKSPGMCNGLHRIQKIRGPSPDFNGRKVVSRGRRRAFYRTMGARFNEENYP